jgi:pimeloyl-ACP methyl ester carboxylesterase
MDHVFLPSSLVMKASWQGLARRASIGAMAVACTLGLTSMASVAAADERQPEDVGILFVGGFQTSKPNYTSYLERFSKTHTHVVFQSISSDMLNPDHQKDFATVKKAADDLVAKGARRIIALGFSSGGKHAARLALENDNIFAIGLLDPVDGGPDPEGKTPLFLKNGVRINKPTLLLASEFGPIPKIAGRACAPKDVGPEHFRAHINPEQLVVDKMIPGASHLNFISKPWNFMFNLACNNGTADHEPTHQSIGDELAAFLENLD